VHAPGKALELRRDPWGIAAPTGAIAEQGLDVSAELPDLRVLGSETLLARMVDNLIDNAVPPN
jgi:signal transduction histidine kinase